MKILVVEDDYDYADFLGSVVSSLRIPGEVQFARSRDVAYKLIASEFFDLIILDLKIPTVDGALDADVQHGQAVLTRCGSDAAGTPLLVVTGSTAESSIRVLLERQQQVDIWGEGRTVGMVRFVRKSDSDQLREEVESVSAAISALDDVELELGVPKRLDDIRHDRLIRIFARRSRGARCVVSQITTGLSGTRVFRLRITGSDGALIHNAIAKIGPHEDVAIEQSNLEQHIVRLKPHATPRHLATIQHGAKNFAGVFIGLADGFDLSAFDCVLGDGQFLSQALGSARNLMRPWCEGVAQTTRTVKECRRRVLSDESFEKLIRDYGISWAPAFEGRKVQVCWCCVHGDLHGLNVLVASDDDTTEPGAGSAIIIDYGDIGLGPASLDPVTLELSALFHPQRPNRPSNWPTLEQARDWGTLERYLEGCPYRQFVEGCRDWTSSVAAGRREVAAAAYSYLIRQLKYQDTDKALVLSHLEGARALFESTLSITAGPS